MFDFEINEDVLKTIDTNKYKEKTIQAISYVNKLCKNNNIIITDYRWSSLVNHVSAMVARSETGETIDGIEESMFEEVDKKSIEIAKELVDYIGNLATDEKFLLSVHFATAKLA